MRRLDLSGKRLAGWMHPLPDAIFNLMPFVEAGVTVRVGACNPDSTDPRVAAYPANAQKEMEQFPTERAEIRVRRPDGEWSHSYRVFANSFVRLERGKAAAELRLPEPRPF